MIFNIVFNVSDIGQFRMRHEAIIKLSQAADRTLNFQATVIVICNAIVLCLALYSVIWVRCNDYLIVITTYNIDTTQMYTIVKSECIEGCRIFELSFIILTN